MISCLPPELVLHVVGYLPLSTISVLTIVAKSWNNFIADYQSTVFRQAAFLHGYIDDPETSLNSPDIRQKYSKRITEGLSSWKTFCRRRWTVQQAWNGCASSTLKFVPTRPSMPNVSVHAVHRIKVDEGAGLVMTTSCTGGLFVMDMDTGRTLWWLPSDYVPAFAHLEYSNGFLIFNREDGDKEVWKLRPPSPRRTEMDDPPLTVDPASRPDFFQELNSFTALASARELQPKPISLRGCFDPYALLHMPETTAAFRFVYPTLATTAHDKVYFWDVPNARLTEVVEGVQMISPEEPQGPPPIPVSLGNHQYVDHGAGHVLLVGRYVIKILRRSSGERKVECILQIPSNQWRYGRWKYDIEPRTGVKVQGCALVRHQLRVTEEEQQMKALADRFVAAHISPCGSHLAILLLGSRLVIIPHFQTLAQSPHILYENILDIQLASPKSYMAVYLAYEQDNAGEGRIGVVTTGAVFIVTIPSLSFPPTTESARPPPPQIRISHIQNLMNSSCLSFVSCLMLSDTGVFVNYDPSSMVPRLMTEYRRRGDQGESGGDMESTEGEMNEIGEMDVESPFNDDTHKVEEARADVDQDWFEAVFEDGLDECKKDLGGCYRSTSAGDFIVAPRIRRNPRPDLSNVFGVNMLP